MVIGDFNCAYDTSSRFYDSSMHFIADNYLICSDAQRVSDIFTYCRDDGLHTSWIDHVLCSKILDDRVKEINIHYEYQTSDHKPLALKLTGLDLISHANIATQMTHYNAKYDWANADIDQYRNTVHSELNKVDIPRCMFDCSHNCDSTQHFSAIDEYYTQLITCIGKCTAACVPVLKC